MKQNHLVQALRGIAALMVVVDHSILILLQGSPRLVSLEPFAWGIGSIGVKIFFMISGYIMVSTTESDFGAPGASLAFMRRRLIRIVPLYWIATMLVILKLCLIHKVPLIADVARSLVFIPYVNAAHLWQPVLGLGWTLNYEMFFYVLFAAAMLFARGAGLALMIGTLMAFIASGYIVPGSFYQNPIIAFFGVGMLIGIAAPCLPKIAFQSRAAAHLGDASYSIYLTHLFVIPSAAYLWLRSFGAVGLVPFTCLMLASTAAVGILAYRFVEKPVLRRLNAFSIRLPSSALIVAR